VADSKARYADELRLKSGVSLSQTRFALSHFCLSNLGADGQHFADALELCPNASLLQEVLNTIAADVRSRWPDRMPALIASVCEANATEVDADPTAAPATPAPAAAPPARSAAPTQPRADAGDPLRLVTGVSLAQARFALSDFCLDHFGSRSQALVEAINDCIDLSSLQKILSRIGTEIK
jgi:ribosomal protein L12E/L44/L45/RPP1/RPP2